MAYTFKSTHSMPDFALPNELFQYTHHAYEQAREAGVQTNRGYRHKQIYYEQERILRKWRELLVNAPIFLHNSLFLLFALADIMVSWEMIRDIVTNNALTPDGWQWIPTLLFCLLINAWAATTAHFAGKGWSREIQDWERWNYIFVKNENLPLPVLNDELRREMNRARLLAIVSGVVLLGVVGAIIYYRIVVSPHVNGESSEEDLLNGAISGAFLAETNSEPLAIILIVLPLAITIGELLTGDYVWYSLRRWQALRRCNRHFKAFLHHKEECGGYDLQAMHYTFVAQQRNEPIQIMGDLEKSCLRAKHRSQESDNYLDPFNLFRRIGFTFRYRSSGQAVVDQQVFGILPNGAKTGDYLTDGQGKVTLQWDGESDRLEIIQILGREYAGPFQANAEHYIDLVETPAGIPLNGHQPGVESELENAR